ncbi:MAG TPA: hypothetical protein VIL84_14470 [Devosiaceae bacterium]
MAGVIVHQLGSLQDESFPAEQVRIVALLVQRVEIGVSGLNVHLRKEGPTALVREITADARAAA